MSIKFDSGRDLALQLLKKATARDLQKKIGASQFSGLCARCVGDALLAEQTKGGNTYWLAATIGTGVHGLLEERAAEVLSSPVIEQSIYIGTLKDYGEIWSKPDLYLPDERLAVDWKTTERSKSKYLRLVRDTEADDYELSAVKEMRFKVRGYYGQIQTYAWGLEKAGHAVEDVSIVFINRDGKTDDDIMSLDYGYDRDYAERLWARLERIWEHVQDEGAEDLPRHEFCFCNR